MSWINYRSHRMLIPPDSESTDQCTVDSTTSSFGTIGFTINTFIPVYSLYEGSIVSINPSTSLDKNAQCYYSNVNDVDDMSRTKL